MKKIAVWLLIALTAASLISPRAFAYGEKDADAVLEDTANYLIKKVASPGISDTGGEWTVFGLARYGAAAPDGYFKSYLDKVEKEVKEKGGVLHERKYTEYSRVILALSSLGKDPQNVGGYDLLKPLGDFDKTVWQGINGPVWALIALNSRSYDIPKNEKAKTQATKDAYLEYILEKQLPDGGFSLTGKAPMDPDLTAMALCALASFKNRPAANAAAEKALSALSAAQTENGAFTSGGAENAESCAQVLTALCELRIPLTDKRFVKNEKTVLDALLSFYVKGKGFEHLKGGGANLMATEQAFYALTAYKRAETSAPRLYDTRDHLRTCAGEGLLSKNEAVKPVKKGNAVSFSDVYTHENKVAIEELSSRGIINGKGSGLFDPDANMTRAEFAAITVRALGLTPKSNSAFSDVKNEWFAPFVGTANAFGIVNGVGGGRFSPNGTITRQEAATMVARAAALCGLSNNLTEADAKTILSSFSDASKVASWAKAPLAFCFDKGILDASTALTEPQKPIKRCEIAQMLYNLLDRAFLL
ncbi:MAG: S-layer homology domain-containing protein [Clostridia bacterium]|nr:S-layer homology domain-containing protein [Clostridia bacterium]